MAYDEYDYSNEPSTGSLKESLYEILHGLSNPQKLREAGTSLKEALQLTPNVTESLGRGGVAQAIGTSGDLRDLRNTINGYLPKSVRNFTQAAEFLANPYATAIQQTAPTTEETLDFVPRATAPYEGYKQHETLGEYVAPSLGYFGGKAAKAYGNYVGPTAYKAVEDYLTKTGGILNAVEPGEIKKIEKVASEIDNLGFYSPLENAILKIGQPKGTGDQFLKQLEKTPGVKTEELEVTGVKQYLQEHPMVTKEELLDYMGHGRVELQNKILNETGVNDVEDYRLSGGDIHHDQDYIDATAEDLRYQLENDGDIRHQETEALLERYPELYEGYENDPNVAERLNKHIDENIRELADSQAHEMYYENPIHRYYDDMGYEIYGNDNMGYTFKNDSGEFLDIGGNRGVYDLSDAEQALREYHYETGNLGTSEGAPKYEDYTLPGKYTNYREVLTYLPENIAGEVRGGKRFNEISNKIRKQIATPEEHKEFGNLVDLGTKKDFESSHFEQPNVLAHTRLNDRIINGKKTLMVEEIQSDWHQAGRRKGYEQNVKPLQETYDKLAQEQHDYLKEMYKKYSPYATDPEKMKMLDTLPDSTRKMVFETLHKQMSPTEIEKYETLFNQNKDALKALQEAKRNTVPDAPFKKNWHELMMKQILNEAVKGDYDAVAFTTGKQQAERYSLSKQISELRAEKLLSGSKEGQYVITATNKNGNPSVNKTVTEEELENFIGKDLAKKIVEDSPDNPDGKTYSGLDLDVGGEGMKGFYDKILPDFVNKYTKKYGMGVKKENLPFRGVPSAHDVYGQALKHGYSKEQFDRLPVGERIKIADEVKPKGEEVHFVDLTDMAKKDIKEKGQPLFSGIGLAAPGLLMDNEKDN